VYSLGSIYPDHAILDVWARNPTTGDLTLLQRLAQNDASLLETGALIASPDGTDVYTLGTGGFASPRLVHFRRAPATGLLTFLGGFGVGGLEAGGLTMRPDGAFVYVTEVNSFLLPSRASVFARDPGTGNLTFVDFLPLVPEHVVATSDHLYGAGGRTDYTALLPEASVHRIDGPTGTGALIDFEHYQPSVGAALLTPDGSHPYVHCPQDDAVVGFAVDAGTGALTPAGKLVDGRGGLAYESDMSVSADGTHVYVASLHGDGIAVLGRNPGTGALTFASAVLDDQDGIDGLGFVQRLAIAPDGGHVYAAPVPFATFYTEVGSDDVVSVLARDGGTGALTPIQSIGQSIPGLIGSFHPGDVTITPDGTYVYVTGDVDGVSGITPVQAAFRRAPATGMLTFERLIERAGYPTMGPDGRQLYLTRDGDVAVLRRNLGDGGATLQQTQSDDDVRVDAPIALAAASPYAHGLADRRTQIAALVTWRRDPVTGSLAPVQVLRSGVGGAPLGQPTDVVQTVDGRYVYVPDGGSNTVARYRHREPCTPAPAVGCRIPLRPRAASLQLSDRPGSTNKVFTLRWARGSAVTPADLGTPTTMTEYVACLYDAAGPQPVASLVAPAGETCGALPCWKPVPSGFAYSDPALTPDGLNKATVSAGADGRSRLIWKAKGPSVPPLGLPLQGPVVLQIQASNGTCWEATFPTATVNDGTTWKGKSG
jgi:DNA-binding beta-propeller fold protein YncE